MYKQLYIPIYIQYKSLALVCHPLLLRTFGSSATSTYNSYLQLSLKICIDFMLFSKNWRKNQKKLIVCSNGGGGKKKLRRHCAKQRLMITMFDEILRWVTISSYGISSPIKHFFTMIHFTYVIVSLQLWSFIYGKKKLLHHCAKQGFIDHNV